MRWCDPLPLFVAAVVATAPLHARAAETHIAWLGENLVANAGFEDAQTNGLPAGWHAVVQGAGAEVSRDDTVRLIGKASLRIATASASSAQVRSDPIPVQAGHAYLASAVVRQEGFNTLPGYQNRFQGVSSWWSVEWHDEGGRVLGSQSCSMPYGPMPWRVSDVFARAPVAAASAVFALSVGNNSLRESGTNVPSTAWVDCVQLSEYHPPPTPAWALGETARIVEGGPDMSRIRAHFVASSPEFVNSRDGMWSKVAVDPQAERGSALVAPAGTGKGLMAHSPYWGAMPAGLYRLRARVKVSDPAAAARAGVIDIDSSSSGPRLALEIRPQSLARSNEYAVLEEDFILRDNGWWDIRLWTDGNQSWAVDSVKVVPLAELEDRQLMAVYPGIGGEIDPGLRPRRDGPCKILLVAGLEYNVWRPEQALRLLNQKVTITPVWLTRGMYLGLAGFPEAPADVFDSSAIVLCNVPANVMSLRQKNVLAEYVRRGGALVVLGGDMAFERGGWRGSMLEDALPLQVKASVGDGLRHAVHGLKLSAVAGNLWLKESDFGQDPRAYFMHRVTLKPDAIVFVRAGEDPFLVGGSSGAGRVMCVLGWPYGDPGTNDTAFWDWSDWVYLFRNAIWWSMRASALE